MSPNESELSYTTKQPRAVLHNIFAFPPNRDTLGGTSYFIVGTVGGILIDCPATDETNQNFLHSLGGVRWFFITHRGAIGKAEVIQKTFACEVLIQEQEAYLLPELAVTTFNKEFTLSPLCKVFWTPGHSPGSSCLYYNDLGGVLFTGRHLLPNLEGEPSPIRTPKTFHWGRQIKHVQSILDEFTPETLHYICPGANTGFLRGKRTIDNAYQRLLVGVRS